MAYSPLPLTEVESIFSRHRSHNQTLYRSIIPTEEGMTRLTLGVPCIADADSLDTYLPLLDEKPIVGSIGNCDITQSHVRMTIDGVVRSFPVVVRDHTMVAREHRGRGYGRQLLEIPAAIARSARKQLLISRPNDRSTKLIESFAATQKGLYWCEYNESPAALILLKR